ncbi:uncharacterized protein PGTG_04871 [Puccinia graminis f. sp. tritici CRL 75-36-700-3]|uniref:Uncharacterized protein n=1 Tax=Puccinia graminis f. sp. tritici (strain CRL 75-36-700-3 / race SCCL) TaxID=418459 RepID=E3K358_PUCGT|nr:uncharacterized protein PGTG_04871 [Puccinia graminis f. sp. tritici CRL 75-36-700-3]EFP78915.1 hypothetical protein PGTG_04871 [Puccinia graminis f. sp. tritici CRL 75-36-700-3]
MSSRVGKHCRKKLESLFGVFITLPEYLARLGVSQLNWDALNQLS